MDQDRVVSLVKTDVLVLVLEGGVCKAGERGAKVW